MVTISKTPCEPAMLTIPAGYLEDTRSALIAEIDSVSDALRTDQAEVLSGRPSGPADRAGAMRWLRNNVQLLDQLLDVSGDTKVSAERDTLTEALQSMVRVLADRLVEQAGYAPIDMGAVLELAGRMRWAAEEAIRIEPGLDERKVA